MCAKVAAGAAVALSALDSRAGWPWRRHPKGPVGEERGECSCSMLGLAIGMERIHHCSASRTLAGAKPWSRWSRAGFLLLRPCERRAKSHATTLLAPAREITLSACCPVPAIAAGVNSAGASFLCTTAAQLPTHMQCPQRGLRAAGPRHEARMSPPASLSRHAPFQHHASVVAHSGRSDAISSFQVSLRPAPPSLLQLKGLLVDCSRWAGA